MGNPENLRAFLELNPNVPKDAIFVDSKNFDAYKSIGFKKLFEVTPKTTKAPQLSGGQWWTYLRNVTKVIPFANEKDNEAVNEGVRRLGGTFVLEGNDVLYAWADSVPGDEPDPLVVLAAVGVAVPPSG